MGSSPCPPRLALRGVSAYWREGDASDIEGFSAERPVSVDLYRGEWLALIGRNGVGKSTLLGAISGSTSFICGEIRLDSKVVAAGDFGRRFVAGLAGVGQHSQFGAEDSMQFAVEDAKDLAFSRRPGLRNNSAIEDVIQQISTFGWLDRQDKLGPRLFDLVVAILTVPRVLILDEVLGAWPQPMQTTTRYLEIKRLLPTTAVVFTDHDIHRALEVGQKALLLRRGTNPELHVLKDLREEVKDRLTTEYSRRGQSLAGAKQEYLRMEELLRDDRIVCTEGDIALRVCYSQGRKAWNQREAILKRCEFLRKNQPVHTLSGGQRIVLAALISHAVGKPIESDELIHLDTNNSDVVRFLSGSMETL